MFLAYESMVSFFHHTNTSYRELTSEFLVTYELERGMINFHRVDTIQFSMWLGRISMTHEESVRRHNDWSFT